jgi:SAM-dependent MidA family methyltransferase
MELALYHPRHGYYTSGRARIGRQGDYFTSVSVGPLFGAILAAQFRAWGVRQVVEVGGARGQLREDVLAAAPELDYRVVEVGEELPARVDGCVLSNELLDAMPVHRLVGDREVYVDSEFREVLGPLTDRRLPRLPAGYRSEFNLRALDWVRDVAERLTAGSYLLTVDYGFERAEYFAPHHCQGHLQCYYRHRRSANPYQRIGQQDLTAHVEFTSVMEAGTAAGLEVVRFCEQGRYLLSVGAAVVAEWLEGAAGGRDRAWRAIQQLTHPGLMGQCFRVLIQRKREAVA